MWKTYNGEFKSDVALAALIGELTVAEISRRYNRLLAKVILDAPVVLIISI